VGVRGAQNGFETHAGGSQDGVGWALGFQPCDGIVEFELSHVSFQNEYSMGVDSPVQLTAQLYGAAEGLAPFVGLGVHLAQNDLIVNRDSMSEDFLFGVHGGLGLRYKVGSLSVNLEGRYLSYEEEEISQLQGLAGLNLHF
jgi:hypothetical protein